MQSSTFYTVLLQGGKDVLIAVTGRGVTEACPYFSKHHRAWLGVVRKTRNYINLIYYFCCSLFIAMSFNTFTIQSSSIHAVWIAFEVFHVVLKDLFGLFGAVATGDDEELPHKFPVDPYWKERLASINVLLQRGC